MNPQELGSLFPIFLTKHNPAWSELFLQEKDLIAGRLVQKKKCAENTLRIRHIGSTSIPGIMAKPTIDILLEITDATNCDHLIREIKNLGYHYIPKPENPPPHMMFVKGYTPEGFRGQSYHLHVRYRGDWDEPYFRNYLSAH
ncbi:MAG: GrpB family protein, partial [Bacteroidales bacterium]|nr:GrpB family protein [Bacteroidales bacterium]